MILAGTAPKTFAQGKSPDDSWIAWLTIESTQTLSDDVTDGDGLVVRLHETHNRPGRVRLLLDRPVRAARRCDALERDLDAAGVGHVRAGVEVAGDGSVLVDVAAYHPPNRR